MRIAAFVLALGCAAAAAESSPRALKPDEGLMIVKVSHTARAYDPDFGSKYWESLTVWDFARNEWRRLPARSAGASDALFFDALPAGKYRLGGVTYSVDNGQVVVTFSLPLAGASPEFTVEAGHLSNLGAILMETLERKDPRNNMEGLRSRATRGPLLDPAAVRSFAVLYPKYAEALGKPALDWDQPDVGTELWEEFKTRTAPAGQPTRDADGALLFPMRQGLLMRVPASGTPELIETWIGSNHRWVRHQPGFGYLMLTQYGGLRHSKTLDGPWLEIIPPGEALLAVADARVVGDSLFVAIFEGIDWSSSLIGEGTFRVERVAVLRRDAAGAWTRVAQVDLGESPPSALLSDTRAVVLSDERLTSVDLATGGAQTQKIEADILRPGPDGTFMANEIDFPFDSRQFHSRDGLKWRQVADKSIPAEARFSHTVALAGGRYGFAGRAKLRSLTPLGFYLWTGNTRKGRDEYKVVGSLPAGCARFPELVALDDEVFAYCDVAPRVHWISLKDGATKEIR